MDSKVLRGKTALVTGGSKGIGASIASLLELWGAEVIRTCRTKSSVAGTSVGAFLDVDFLDDASVSQFIDEMKDRKIDILVNNAGINSIAPFCSTRVEDFDQVIKVNLRGPFLTCQAVLPHMLDQGWGRIVNIASVFGVVSKSFRAPYSASKFGIDGLTAALAAEVAGKGILVNTVSPGFVKTELTRRILGEEAMEKIASTVPIERLAEPDEIAALVGWLCSPQNTYASGQNYIIDGGFTRV
jgi:NAD(P)-dependent dehydrogenase (short-subunit alcohol dehydrogenase family)